MMHWAPGSLQRYIITRQKKLYRCFLFQLYHCPVVHCGHLGARVPSSESSTTSFAGTTATSRSDFCPGVWLWIGRLSVVVWKTVFLLFTRSPIDIETHIFQTGRHQVAILVHVGMDEWIGHCKKMWWTHVSISVRDISDLVKFNNYMWYSLLVDVSSFQTLTGRETLSPCFVRCYPLVLSCWDVQDVRLKLAVLLQRCWSVPLAKDAAQLRGTIWSSTSLQWQLDSRLRN